VSLAPGAATKLVLSGPLSALRCPSGTQNNEQLAFLAGPANGATTSVGQLTPGNDSGYLEVSSLELAVSQLTALAQPNGAAGNGQLTISRQGGTCNGEFPRLLQHSVLVTFALNFGSVQITTARLPDAIAGSTYSAALTATGGTAPFTWSATGLPAGLSLDAQSGVISGTPTSLGSALIVVTVTGADGSSAQRTLALLVNFPLVPAGTWDLNIHLDSHGLPNVPVLIIGRFSNATSGRLAGTFTGLFYDGRFFDTLEPVSGTIAASVAIDALGQPTLVDVTITPVVDRTALGRGLCNDVVVRIPGPVGLDRRVNNSEKFNTIDPSTGADLVAVPSQCGGQFSFTGFDLGFVSP
jgi:hypothetical protein